MAPYSMDMGDLIDLTDPEPAQTQGSRGDDGRDSFMTGIALASHDDSGSQDGETYEDTFMENTEEYRELKRQKLPKFEPPRRPSTPPRNNAPRGPRLTNTDRFYRPIRQPRFISVPREQYQRFIEWQAIHNNRDRGWKAEDRFVASNPNWQPTRSYLEEMADERRGNYNRGYAGGGGRKRKFYGDDDDSFDRSRHRRDMPRNIPTAERVRDQLFGIADHANRNAIVDCYDLASLIVSNQDDKRMVAHLPRNVLMLVTEQPMKIPHAAAIVRHLNDKKPALVARILEEAHKTAQEAIDNGNWRALKLVLRFYAILLPILEGGAGIVTLLDELFNRASDLQMADADDALGLEVVKTIQLTIPFVMGFGPSQLIKPVDELLQKTAIIASAPDEDALMINPYMSTDSEQAPKLTPLVTLLQSQIENEAKTGFPLKVVPRLYDEYDRNQMKPEDPMKTEEANGDANGEEKPTLSFPTLTVPPKLNTGSRPHFPEVFFSLYADQDVETVPPTTVLASTLIRDICVDTINLLDFNRERAVKYLIDLDNYFPKSNFAERGTAFDKLREAAAEGEPTWKTEDLLMDAIFSQLMTLPTPEHKLVYYHSCITFACREAAATIAPSLGRAIRFMYRSLETLDLELGYRFMDWFSHHLSNYDFRWKWQEWTEDVDRSPLHPRNAFIRGVLDKEIRLSFARRIRESLPESYGPLVPESKDNDIPLFKYNNNDTDFAEEGRTILNAIKRKQPDTDIVPTLTAIEEGAAAKGLPPTVAIDAYVTALCFIGSKSLSHVLSFIERCKHRLLAFSHDAPDPNTAMQARTQIIDSVVEYWRATQAGVAVNIVGKLLNYGILSPASVATWALGAGANGAVPMRRANVARTLPEAWLFEMVSSTLAKVSGRVRQIVAARMSPGLSAPQVAHLDQTLEGEARDMVALFESVGAALDAVAADGAGAGMSDSADGEDAAALLRWWGARWRRVFARKRLTELRVLAQAKASFEAPVAQVEVGAAATAMAVDGDAAGEAKTDVQQEEDLIEL